MYKKLIIIAVAIISALSASRYLLMHNPGIFNTKGFIADSEKHLIITAILIMLIAALPVVFLVFYFAWKYRATNPDQQYAPDWDHNSKINIIKWVIPTTIVVVLAVITWHTSHALDPYKPIASTKPAVKIEVVALRWKWLFIYPEQKIATINFVEIPENTPVKFLLTADGPMNSFWIPQLGGQMYAMAGMMNQLNLIANTTGQFQGSAAEINGQGFSGMKFTASSATDADFNNWVSTIKKSPNTLDSNKYNTLAQPSENNPVDYFGSVESNLYENIIKKYMAPDDMKNMDMSGMQMH